MLTKKRKKVKFPTEFDVTYNDIYDYTKIKVDEEQKQLNKLFILKPDIFKNNPAGRSMNLKEKAREEIMKMEVAKADQETLKSPKQILKEIKARKLDFEIPVQSGLPLNLVKIMDQYKIKVNKLKDMQEQAGKIFSKVKDNPNCYYDYKKRSLLK